MLVFLLFFRMHVANTNECGREYVSGRGIALGHVFRGEQILVPTVVRRGE